MLRMVVGYEFCGACRYTGYVDKSVELKLACGHVLYRKVSQGVPKKAKCRECAAKKRHGEIDGERRA
jgi:hypothetical protein